jgi:hypothetical protein
MKKILLMVLASFLAFQVEANCNVVCGNHVTMGHVIKGSTHGGGAKSPVRPFYLEQDNNILTMEATICDYTLNLYDEDGELAYSVFVPSGTTQVVLPTTLAGYFEIRFETSTDYYYGFIDL